MNIIGIIFIFLLAVSNLFLIAALIIEHNFSENHPVMIWWRKHMVGKVADDDPNF